MLRLVDVVENGKRRAQEQDAQTADRREDQNQTAAATFGLINSAGHLGGLFAYVIGDLSDRTHSFLPGFAFIGSCFWLAAFLVMRLKIRNPAEAPAEVLPLQCAAARESRSDACQHLPGMRT